MQSLALLCEPAFMIIQTAIIDIIYGPTQRLLVDCTIETEAKKAHEPGTISPCSAVSHR